MSQRAHKTWGRDLLAIDLHKASATVTDAERPFQTFVTRVIDMRLYPFHSASIAIRNRLRVAVLQPTLVMGLAVAVISRLLATPFNGTRLACLLTIYP